MLPGVRREDESKDWHALMSCTGNAVVKRQPIDTAALRQIVYLLPPAVKLSSLRLDSRRVPRFILSLEANVYHFESTTCLSSHVGVRMCRAHLLPVNESQN